MKPIARIGFTLLLTALAGLSGCSTNVRNASPLEIKQLTTVETDDKLNHTWTGPDLQLGQYRSIFRGYNTVEYRLVATKPDTEADGVAYKLEIDANYGGEERHYNVVKTAKGKTYNTSHRVLTRDRCEFFNNEDTDMDHIVFGCLFRETADAELDLADLEAARQFGLTLTLGSGDTDYEQIDLPSQYIDGFLRAVRNQ